jgi:hypothetical protein
MSLLRVTLDLSSRTALNWAMNEKSEHSTPQSLKTLIGSTISLRERELCLLSIHNKILVPFYIQGVVCVQGQRI